MNYEEIKKFSIYLIFITFGAICLFAAVFIPGDTIRMILAAFGLGVILGYVNMIYRNIYSPIKKRIDLIK